MSAILNVVKRYRAALLMEERREVLRLARLYVDVWGLLKSELADVLTLIENAGKDATPAWLAKQVRYQRLMRMVEREIKAWAQKAGASAVSLQSHGIGLGLEYIDEVIRAASHERLYSRVAVETLAGMTADGSPLASLFDDIGDRARTEWEKSLALGVAAGKASAEIAKMAHEATATGLARATTIARTEMLRAYRVAAHETARGNPRVVKGWIWCASLSTETCIACIAMHGTVHSMDEDFNDHPNGRCAAVYFTSTTSAEALAARLPDAKKWIKTLGDKELTDLFGKGAVEVWKSGRLPLRKFAALRRNDMWGDTYQPTPLHQLLGEE